MDSFFRRRAAEDTELSAEEIARRSLEFLSLSLKESKECRKGDFRKVAIASILKSQTEVTNHWIATRLEMGHENSINRHIRNGRTDAKTKKIIRKLEKMFKCVDWYHSQVVRSRRASPIGL